MRRRGRFVTKDKRVDREDRHAIFANVRSGYVGWHARRPITRLSTGCRPATACYAPAIVSSAAERSYAPAIAGADD
jgi:hypothetical protein